jgi:hypothetical protein
MVTVPNHRRRNYRSEAGQGLVEGAVGISLVTLFAVIGLFFILNAAFSAYYLLKLQTVALNTAQFAANSATGDVTATAKQFANDQLRSLGLPQCAFFQVEQLPQATVVTIGLNGLRLVGDQGTLPSVLQLRDTELATPSERTVGYMQLEINQEAYRGGILGTPSMPTGTPAFVPIISAGGIDVRKRYMIDTINWPATHVVYHGAYPNFPNYRGSRFQDPGSTQDQTADFDASRASGDPVAQSLWRSIKLPFPCTSKYKSTGPQPPVMPLVPTRSKCTNHVSSGPCGLWWDADMHPEYYSNL